MARYRILTWRGIPAQLKVYPDEGRPRSVKLADWYVQEVDRVAMREDIIGSDEYLALWEWSEDLERPGTPDEVVAEVVAEIDAHWRPSADRAEGGRAMTYRVLVTDYMWPNLDIERGILADVDAELVVAEQGTEDELTRLAEGVDAILTNWKKVPPAALDVAPDCVVVSRYGVGVDNIPVAHATELGIMVVNVPDFCLDEVSDHAMALLLALARRVVSFAEATRADRWDLLGGGRGLPRLRGQQLGLVGFGNIARRLVPKAQGFGLEVVAYTPRLGPGTDPSGVRTTNDLEALLASSDYVSLHAPATPATIGLIGEAELRAMKPTAYLINTSRGALVDEAALGRALTEGWIAGAGLDVLAQEPPPAGHPLLALPNVIATPHAGFYSEPAIAELATKAARNAATALRGEVPATILNAGVLDQENLRLRR